MMNEIFRRKYIFSILFCILALFLIKVSPVYSSIPPFESVETFSYSDGTSPAPGWETTSYECTNALGCVLIDKVLNSDDTEAKWIVNNGHYGLHITPHSPLTFTQSTPQNWPTGLNNYSVTFKINMLDTTYRDRNFVFRYQNKNNWYGLHFYGNYVYLEKSYRETDTNFSDSRNIAARQLPFQDDQTYSFEITVYDNQINVYFDNESTPIFIYEDEEYPILNGSAGPQSGSGSGSSGDVWFDDILILPFSPASTPTPTSTPTPSYLQVLDIKQGTSPWGSQEYDSAHKWAAANPTISRWGCALTSAVMAMRYHGFINVWPDILNNWLKATPGGYTKDGGVNWIAISRYTKLFPNLSGESLEYKFFNSNLHPLSFLLDNNIVPIINFPHHFLIAKGYTNPSDYLINDPASDLITLSAAITKWGNIKKIAYYQPSKSDLSYLYFVVDPNVNLNLFNSLGNQVNMEYIFSEPLVDDTDPTIYGLGPFGKYFLPQPPIDKYKLEITGNGPYSIDSYFYNIEGNVRIATISGTITTNNNVDKYTLTYNYQNPTIKKDDIITINVLIKDIENVHKQKLIPSYLYYLELRSQAVLAKMLINKKQSKDAKVVLRLMKWSLNAANSRLIKSEAKQILLNDINSLISSLP